MKFALASVALLALAACSDPIEERDDETLTTTVDPTPAEPVSQATLVPGILDEGLRRDRNLMGELGCVFSRGNEVLFAAVANSANIEGAEGLVVLDGQPVEVSLDGDAGYNALQSGASFTGEGGLSVDIEVSREAEIRETPAPATGPAPMIATMTLARGGQDVSVEGRYECGPQPEA